jgi:hypothetical protein
MMPYRLYSQQRVAAKRGANVAFFAKREKKKTVIYTWILKN